MYVLCPKKITKSVDKSAKFKKTFKRITQLPACSLKKFHN